jgi:hypothetical protein
MTNGRIPASSKRSAFEVASHSRTARLASVGGPRAPSLEEVVGRRERGVQRCLSRGLLLGTFVGVALAEQAASEVQRLAVTVSFEPGGVGTAEMSGRYGATGTTPCWSCRRAQRGGEEDWRPGAPAPRSGPSCRSPQRLTGPRTPQSW